MTDQRPVSRTRLWVVAEDSHVRDTILVGVPANVADTIVMGWWVALPGRIGLGELLDAAIELSGPF